MKRLIWILTAVFGIALLLTACTGPFSPAPNEPECGGVTDNTDPNAPKTVASTEIVAFECYFNTLNDMERDGELGIGEYRLKAELRDGVAVGVYDFRDRYNDRDVRKDFTADTDFFRALQEIVAKYDFAQFNGKSYFVAGLPEDFGAKLDVRYASDESIYAADNQDGFLPRASMIELKQLFESACTDVPELVDLTVQTEYDYDEADGRFFTNKYALLEPGCADWDGKVRMICGSEGLYAALEQYNDEARLRNAESWRELHETAKQLPADAPRELNVESAVYVTRNDSTVVSFYERTRETGLLRETRTIRARNIATPSGELLDWNDVFADLDALPELLDRTFRAEYPDLRFGDDSLRQIADAIQNGGEDLCFVLADGAARVFAAEYFLVPAWQELSVTLPYGDFPELVKPEYQAIAPTRLTRMEYDTDYFADGTVLRMHYQGLGEYGEDIRWTLSVNGRTLQESFYGYAPDCWLLRTNGQNYVYLRFPATDVSMETWIYEITPEGAEKLGEVPLAPSSDLNLNPERMQMQLNDYFYADPFGMIPVGLYRVGKGGFPELVREDYGVQSGEMELTNFASLPTADPADPEWEGEKQDVPAGTVLTPFRTDRKSYLDFLIEDGGFVRFRIDKFGDDMTLIDYGKPGEIFKRPEN